MIKRYVAFACNEYEGECGWNDYQMDGNDLEKLRKEFEKLLSECPFEWYHIVDLKTKQIVFRNMSRWDATRKA